MMMKLLNTAMLNSTLIKSNKYTPSLTTVKDPFQILKKFVRIFDKHMKQKNIKLSINETINGDIDTVDTFMNKGIKLDINLYKQILFNIYANACKFNTDDGSIFINFSVQDDDPADVGSINPVSCKKIRIKT